MARDWNDYEAKIREEIERKVADAQHRAERKAERIRERAERAARRAQQRGEWYAKKVQERAEWQADQATHRLDQKLKFFDAARQGSPWAFNIGGPGCENGGGSGVLVGLAILGFGAAMLLSNLGIFQFHDIFDFWPVLLIAAGAMRMGRARFASARVFGAFLMMAGVVLLLGNLHVMRVSWNLFWPAILILVGLQHLTRSFDPPKQQPPQPQQPSAPAGGPPPDPFANPGMPPPPPSYPSGRYTAETPTSGPRPVDVPPAPGPGPMPGPQFGGASAAAPPPPPPPPFPAGATIEPDVHLHEYCIFTGGKRRIVTNNFRGGEIVAVFGGVDVDLRNSQIGGDEAVIDITAAFGGCTIKVPLNWYVDMRGVAAFGGYSNKTIPPRLSPGQRLQKLVVTGSAAFGGVVIEN